MMNLKETINFKTLREKGPSSVEVKNDEVVQLVSRNSDIKVIISQEYFLELLNAHNALLKRAGHIQDEEVNVKEKLKDLEAQFSKIADLVNEDADEEAQCKQDGRKLAGSL